VVKETVVVAAGPSGKPLLRFFMYNFDPWLQALPKIFSDFEQEVGTAEVKLESAPWDQFWPRFESQAAAGIAPDLQIGDPFKVARYCDKGVYLNIDPYIERDGVDLAQWYPVTIEACRFEKETGLMGRGPVFGLPATYVGTVTYYNKDLFDEAGVGYPNEDWTRLEFQDAAVKLTKDANGKRGDEAGFDPENVAVYGCSTIGGYATAVHLWNNGGGLVSDDQKECWIDKPESIEIFQWLADLIHKYHCNPAPAWFQGQPDVFLTQKIAMKLDGTWNLDYYVEKLTFNWDIAVVPKGTKGLPRVTYAGTNTLHIFSGTKYPDQSWDLLKFMAGPGGMKYFMKTGTPCLIAAAESEEYLTGKPEHRRVAIEIGSYARTYYPHLGNDRWKEIYNQEIQALYLGEKSAEEVCRTICEKINPILKEIARA
jgi:multiple sugar transport system substrate-binding protein